MIQINQWQIEPTKTNKITIHSALFSHKTNNALPTSWSSFQIISLWLFLILDTGSTPNLDNSFDTNKSPTSKKICTSSSNKPSKFLSKGLNSSLHSKSLSPSPNKMPALGSGPHQSWPIVILFIPTYPSIPA